jgi:AbrB family looped-hinge helix DNA binding protein
MNVTPNRRGASEQEFESSVSVTGQITLPIEIRKKLGVQTNDRVVIRVEADGIKILPTRSEVDTLYGSVAPLVQSLTLEEMRQVYRSELIEEYTQNDR